MPSVNAGKYKIKSIKVFKEHVTLSFLKRDKLQISKEAYLSSYLYEGKSLSSKEIDKLIEITSLNKLLNVALSLAIKKRYSERKMYEKLKAKEEDKASIMKVISVLKEKGLLNDQEYMNDLIARDNERQFGKNKIIKHLKDQGVKEELIVKASFSPTNETKKAKALLPKLDKKYSRYAYEIKKKHIFNALVSQGYEMGTIKQVIGETKKDQPKKEKEKLKNDYIKIKSRYAKKYEGYELNKRVYAALVNKGYKHTEIRSLLEDYDDENGY